ncbi:hypothetical protein BJ165DRAFT_1533893 [Panaeolus papilionaceus]|nr:hypothetical protein BJ165DRAFT_1533893 [Panaeolus papilionaceus]
MLTQRRACTILAERPDVVIEQARKLMTQHQFNNEPLGILPACLASGLKIRDSFITSTLQHLFMEMKRSDTAVKNLRILRWHGRYAATATTGGGAGKKKTEDGDEDDEAPEPTAGGRGVSAKTNAEGIPRIPTKENPVIVVIYRQICVATKSYQSAIRELSLRLTYSLFFVSNPTLFISQSTSFTSTTPNDPMICLRPAIASIWGAMQCQSDNSTISFCKRWHS